MLEDSAADAVAFLASFPPIQSAIRVGQDGARIQLDIPETEMPSIVRLMLMRGVVLRITVEVEQGFTNGSTETRRRAARSPLDVAGG